MPVRAGVPHQPYSFLIEKLDDLIIAQDHTGAVRFSGYDASTVIQSALNALTSGGKVFIKNGVYNLVNRIEIISKSNIALVGESWQAQLVETADYPCLYIKDSDNILVQGLSLKGYKESAHYYPTLGFNNATNLRIVGCEVFNGQHNGIISGCLGPTEEAPSYKVWIVGNYIHDNLDDAIDVTVGSSEIIIENNIVENNELGISLTPLSGRTCKNVVIRGNVLRNIQSNYGINIGEAGTVQNVAIEGNVIDKVTGTTSGGHGIRIYGTGTYRLISIVGNVIQNADYNGIYVSAANAYDVVIAENTIYNVISDAGQGYGKGINVQYAVNPLIIGNYIEQIYWEGIFVGNTANGGLVCNNIVRQAVTANITRASIRLNNANYITVANNICTNTLTNPRGIIEDGTSNNNVITHNDLRQITGTKLTKVGADTVVKSNLGYVTEHSGTATFSGNGSQTQFTIAHGLAGTPKSWRVEAGSADAKGDKYVTADATNLYVTFATAPPSGTNNVVLVWQAEM